MKHHRITFITIFILIFCSCNIRNDVRLHYYHEALQYIRDSTLYNHFPDEDLIRKNSVNIPCVGGNGLEIVIYLKKEQQYIDDFIKEQTKKSLIRYSIKDSCTNYYFCKDDSLFLKYGDCIKKNPPVSNYKLWLDPNETMFDYEDIKDDLTYYVIESKSGKYLPDSLLTMNEPPYEYVYNGFSKGYAVSRNANLIVYWLIIW